MFLWNNSYCQDIKQKKNKKHKIEVLKLDSAVQQQKKQNDSMDKVVKSIQEKESKKNIAKNDRKAVK